MLQLQIFIEIKHNKRLKMLQLQIFIEIKHNKMQEI